MNIKLNATVTFGLVSFPVGIASATTRTETVKFKLLHETCGLPIKTKKVCPECGISVEPDEIVHGYEFAKGQFVHVAEEEIAAVKSAKQPVIAVSKFLSAEALGSPPVSDSHWLVPDKLLTDPYALLRGAMQSTETVAFGVCNLWGSERPFLIETRGDRLFFQRLFTSVELVEPDFDVPTTIGEGELDLAIKIVASKLGWPEVADLVVDDQTALRDLVERKVKGSKPRPVKAEKPIEVTTDLMADLKRSVARKRERVTS